MRLSVIIPALNEAGNIRAAIESVRACGRGVEIIVADGGSRDSTVEAARELGVPVVETAPGRGLQMDAGAGRASGDVFLFLHADSRLPEGWYGSMEEALSMEGVVAGAFRLSVDSPGLRFRVLEAGANLRARAFGLIYGDQAIFARKEAFYRAGGFRKLPLMEDVDCVKRLRSAGRVIILKEKVRTSPRRWAKRGVIRNALRNSLFLALYWSGVSPEELYKRYYSRA